MKRKLKILTAALIIISISVGGTSYSGVLKSLDDELTSLVDKTEPYLVTVKGKRAWRNLIATGIVYDKRGYVITSSHAYSADEFEITFKDGAEFQVYVRFLKSSYVLVYKTQKVLIFY